MSDFVFSLIANIFTLIALIVAIYGIFSARQSFKRTTTLQTEMFILEAYKDYMSLMLSETNEKIKNNATTRFLMAIDLYYKYVINDHLDKKLSEDNFNFYKECILIFKADIKKDINGYNNIVDYANKYKIKID